MQGLLLVLRLHDCISPPLILQDVGREIKETFRHFSIEITAASSLQEISLHDLLDSFFEVCTLAFTCIVVSYVTPFLCLPCVHRQDEPVEYKCEKCDCTSSRISHRFASHFRRRYNVSISPHNSSISKLPRVLTLHLKRFQYVGSVRAKVLRPVSLPPMLHLGMRVGAC